MLYPQNGDRVVPVDFVTSFHPIIGTLSFRMARRSVRQCWQCSRCGKMAAEATRRYQQCLLSSRTYPEFEDGSCDFVNTSLAPPLPPSQRPLCRIPCAHADFENILVRGMPTARTICMILTTTSKPTFLPWSLFD